MSPSNARVNEVERTLATNKIVFDSGHLQHECERPDPQWKYLNNNKAQRIDPGPEPAWDNRGGEESSESGSKV